MSRFPDHRRTVRLSALTALTGLLLASVMVEPAPADPDLADGPVPGVAVTVHDGDHFGIVEMTLPVQDSRGIARVETSPSKTTVRFDATILFSRDSAVIRSSARGRLDEVGRQLRDQDHQGRLVVTGYTDDLGSAAHGLRLSRARAAAVAAALAAELPAEHYPTRVLGRGESDPRVPNDSEEHRRLNRRVEVEFRPA